MNTTIHHSTVKMKPADVKSSTCIHFNEAIIKEAPKFKVDDHVRVSKYKNNFAKGCRCSKLEWRRFCD